MKNTFAALILIGLTSFTINKNSINNWFKAGDSPESYISGIDDKEFKTGSKSAYLQSVKKSIKGFSTVMQTCNATSYLGKKIKITASIKTEKVKKWAGLWLRIDGETTETTLGFNNMSDRPIEGTTDWTEYSILMNVPETSKTLNFGALLNGNGKIWLNDVKFEVISVMDNNETLSPPSNLNFEK
mgnify:CR=1 FL=1|tara:strand:- start:1542 stop:2096 length:555 start_codon:yes stop_codon:yes gene_type:complete